ncbi:MAG: SpoIIE family protein phosphatase [Clostridia bacterium]|nr:SpoIIE family protein phosphatase [Clostridia bacterium]
MEKTDSGKKKEKGIMTYLSKWVGRYVKTEKDEAKAETKAMGKGIKGIFSFILAFSLSRAEVMGGTMPFGLALLTVSEKSFLWILGGCLLSYLYGGESTVYVVAALLIAALRFTVSYILEGRRERVFSEPISLRLAVGAAGGFVCGIYGIFSGGFQKEQLFQAIFLIFAVPMEAYLYSGATGEGEKGEAKSILGTFALYLSLLVGLKSVSIVGFSPATVVGSLMTLTTAISGGSVKGGLIGMAGGLCISGRHAVMMGLMGAITGNLRRYSQIVAVGGGCVSGVIFALVTGGGESLSATVPALLWGGAICLPLIRFGGAGKLNILGSRTLMSEEASSATMLVTKKEEAMRTRLNALSDAMTSLSGVFYALSNRLTTPGAWQVRQICEASFKKYCRSCSRSAVCWGREYESTSDVMNKLANAVVRHGNADSSYVPSHFLSVCPNTVKALSEVNLSHARLLENAARQNKTEVFALDYEAMAKLLSEASEENSQEYVLDGPLTDKVRKAALDMGMGFHSIAVYGKRKKTVIGGGIDLENVRLSAEEMRKAFENACGIPLTTPEFKLDGDCTTMLATAKRTVECESARASAKKKGEEVNGDSAIAFENREDKYYALISDGMGSGEEASMTSKTTGIFLSKLLSVGNKKHTVLKMLNNFIRNKNLECFATVDLLEIDMLTGEASFIKSGAAASYIIRKGRLFKIASTSLPIGITREIASEEVRFKLEKDDLIVMISDGVSQSFEDGAWLLSMLSEEIDASSSLANISRSILERAKKNNERSDDMTVVAVRVA